MGIQVTQIATRPKVSNLLVDANLDMGASYKVITTSVQARPGGGMHLRDDAGTSKCYAAGGGLFVDDINEMTAGLNIDFNSNLDMTGKSIIGFAPAAPTGGTVAAFKFTPERINSTTVYVRLMPEVLVLRTGTVRVQYDRKGAGIYHQITRNGVAVTPDLWYNDVAYGAYVEDVAVTAGDFLSVEIKNGAATAYIRQFWIGTPVDPLGLCVMTQPARESL